jgi:hypothetical protein
VLNCTAYSGKRLHADRICIFVSRYRAMASARSAGMYEKEVVNVLGICKCKGFTQHSHMLHSESFVDTVLIYRLGGCSRWVPHRKGGHAESASGQKLRRPKT